MSRWSARTAPLRQCVCRRATHVPPVFPVVIRTTVRSVVSDIGSTPAAFDGLGFLGLGSVAGKTALNGGLSAEWGVQLRA